MNKAGVDKIITHDRDFVTVPDITVFTANEDAIAFGTSEADRSSQKSR